MTEQAEVLELDAQIDQALVRRESGVAGDSLLDALASLDDLEWPDRGMGERIAASLQAGKSSTPALRNPSTRAALAIGLAALAAAGVILFAFIVVTPSHTTKHALTPTTGKWRLAGFYEPPGWKQTGQSGPTGPMTCPSVSTCYLVNSQLFPSGNDLHVSLFALSVSHDHGTTWSTLPVTGLSSFTTGLSCPDSAGQVCLAGGMQGPSAALFTTEDGGHSWVGKNLPPNTGHLSALACTTRQHCVGVFTSNESVFSQQGNTEVTENGGATWTPVATQGALLNTITCNGETCIADGDLQGASPGALGTPATLYSHDSGSTWQQSTLPAGVMMDAYDDQVACPTDRVCWAIGVTGSAGLADSSVVVKSADGGATWSYSPSPPSTQLLYFAISCGSTTDCWIGGGGSPDGKAAGSVVRVNANGTITSEGPAVPLMWNTTDGGSTWSLIAITPPTTIPSGTSPSSVSGIGQIACPTKDVCVAVGQGDAGARYTATYSNAPINPQQ